jgi:glycosyltransferase involved in cell wall biosynthesis
VPVITSNVSALPEVVGDGGILVDPRSVDDIRAAIERLLYSDTLRAQLSRKARARAELFRWERAARQSLEFFSSLTG